jgi:SAM-dependent methyltransferase
MGQITSGARAVLGLPIIYNVFQYVMGGRRDCKELAKSHIKAPSGSRILDIGCGTAGLLEFLPKDITYVGYDPSENYIEFAKQKYGARGEFHCGFYEHEQARQQGKFDIIVACAVLHHMDDKDAHALLNLVTQSLAPGGKFFTIDPVYWDSQGKIAKFIIDCDRGLNVRKSEGYTELVKGYFSKITGNMLHYILPPYTNWVMECSL